MFAWFYTKIWEGHYFDDNSLRYQLLLFWHNGIMTLVMWCVTIDELCEVFSLHGLIIIILWKYPTTEKVLRRLKFFLLVDKRKSLSKQKKKKHIWIEIIASFECNNSNFQIMYLYNLKGSFTIIDLIITICCRLMTFKRFKVFRSVSSSTLRDLRYITQLQLFPRNCNDININLNINSLGNKY